MKQVLMLYPLFAAFAFVNFAVEAQSIRGLKRTLLESKATKEPKSAKQSKASKTKAPKTTKAAKGSKSGKTAVPSSSPTVTQTMAPTRTVSPSASPTVSPTDQPSPSPSASPSGQPSPSPSDVPTFHPTSSPTDHPSLSPSAGPTPVPTPSPSEQPSHSPNASPSTSPTVTNVPTTMTASPTPAPVASASSVCEYDTSAQFAPIATDGGKAIVDFYYYKEGQTSNDDYGYTHDDDYYYDQIPDLPDENLQVGENGYISFPYPFGCKATDTCLNNGPATLYLFNVTLDSNPLKGKDKVYVKEMGDDIIVSWEHVAGKDDSGDVNIQATLRTDGSLTVCTACGSLPTDLVLDILMDRSGSQYDAGTAFRINPAPTSTWPTNMCYDWIPPETNPPTTSPTPPPHVCPAGTGFNPISSDSDAGPVEFYYYEGGNENPRNDDYGYTFYDDDGQIPGFSDSDIYVMENGRVDILGTTKWGCNEAGCNGTQVLLFFEDGPASNPLKADGNVYIKDTTVGSDKSFLISWEDAGFKTGTGTVNFQAEIFDTGAVKVCFGAGTLAINAELDVEVHTWLKTPSMDNPTTTKADLADLGVRGWPEEGSCYCAGPSKNYFQVVE